MIMVMMVPVMAVIIVMTVRMVMLMVVIVIVPTPEGFAAVDRGSVSTAAACGTHRTVSICSDGFWLPSRIVR
jgi:hypothetical protein